MTLLLVDRPPADRPSLFDVEALTGAPARTDAEDVGRQEAVPGPPRAARLTLEALVSGVWEGLVARRSVACPVCGGAMHPAGGAGATMGHCRDCGASLS